MVIVSVVMDSTDLSDRLMRRAAAFWLRNRPAKLLGVSIHSWMIRSALPKASWYVRPSACSGKLGNLRKIGVVFLTPINDNLVPAIHRVSLSSVVDAAESIAELASLDKVCFIALAAN